ncbi:MAG: BamA/TamA family outer membrane protein [Candidatus Eremiobacteraeota bacterium]|nr:BamA/TamA family outer membrane protein [Candidatus Eremiobacteraeota bacterium]
MTFDLRRVLRALVRCASALLVLSVVLTLVAAPARSAAAPQIVSVDVTGNLHVPTATIMGVVGARPGTPYDPRTVSADLQRINALGYFADVAPPLVRPRPNGVAITYRVIENPVISAISFTGNQKVPSDTLLALMDLSVGQVFNTNTFRQDVLKINNYYERIGYGGQVPTHVKDLNFNAKTGSLALTIQEGLVVRQIIIGGDPLLPPTILLPQLTLKPGMEYSDDIRTKDAEALKKFYDDKLHVELGNFEGGIDPSSIDLKNGTADVKYNVYVARVAAVQITGNTRTKDQVVRRELRVRPGMVLNTDAVKRDYERLNSTNFFSKVNPDIKEGPDPKKPQDVTLVWEVTEQRTAAASVGFGYSGGITGQGLYGTLGYQDSNLHGTGNSASVQLQRGARTYTSQIQVAVPYFGNTPKSQRYSVGASLFSNGSTYFYPVYPISSTTAVIGTAPAVGGSPAPVPVTLYPSQNTGALNGIFATSKSSANGASFNVGRRLSDYIQAGVSSTIQSVKYQTLVPTPYYFQGNQPNVLIGPTPGPLNSTTSNNLNGSFGIAASSIANVNTGQPYQLDSVTLSLGTSTATIDDPFNPRRGYQAQLSSTISSPSILRSSFSFTQDAANLSRFFPVLKSATLALHGLGQISTGVIPPSALFTFSDQQLRGYDQVFYATDAYLGQAELRQPLTADRKLSIVGFVDGLDYRIRGAQPLLDPYTNRIIGFPGDWARVGDVGFGFRFDVPQLGLRTVRIDFARGANGTHTSFGIGQSF